MFGMIPFVKAAGRGLGRIFKGKEAEETLQNEIKSISFVVASGLALIVIVNGSVAKHPLASI